MSIYDTLKSDHDKHRELLDRIADTSGDSEERREAWNEFYYDVGGHAAAEEEAFYAPLIATEDGQSEGRHSVSEHKQLDDIMQQLNEMDMSSPGWLTRFKTLDHDYRHHIEEEEQDIFPVARKVLGDDADGTIADKFTKRKAAERKLVDEKAEAALEE